MTDRWRVAWVTGASTGIGWAIAERLARSGVQVAISSRTIANKMLLPNMSYYRLDVTDEGAVEDTIAKIEKDLGPIDLAVFAAGTYLPFSADTMTAENFHVVNAVNYIGVVNCLSPLAYRMMARKSGHISWIASVAGYGGLPKAAYYAPTKAALINLAECMKLELQAQNIKISVINPGFVRTPMTSVNDFEMPFLMEPMEAAEATIRGLKSERFEISYPAPFVAALKLLRMMPYPIYFWVTRFLTGKKGA